MLKNLKIFLVCASLSLSAVIFFRLCFVEKVMAALPENSLYCTDQEKLGIKPTLSFFDGLKASLFPSRNVFFYLQQGSGGHLNIGGRKYAFCFPKIYRIYSPAWRFDDKDNYESAIPFFSFDIHYPSRLPYGYSAGEKGVHVSLLSEDKKYMRAFRFSKEIIDSNGHKQFSDKNNFLNLKIESMSKVVGFFYDANGYPVVITLKLNTDNNYGAFAVLNDDIEVTYSYDKKINASHTEVYEFVMSVIKDHMIN